MAHTPISYNFNTLDWAGHPGETFNMHTGQWGGAGSLATMMAQLQAQNDWHQRNYGPRTANQMAIAKQYSDAGLGTMPVGALYGVGAFSGGNTAPGATPGVTYTSPTSSNNWNLNGGGSTTPTTTPPPASPPPATTGGAGANDPYGTGYTGYGNSSLSGPAPTNTTTPTTPTTTSFGAPVASSGPQTHTYANAPALPNGGFYAGTAQGTTAPTAPVVKTPTAPTPVAHFSPTPTVTAPVAPVFKPATAPTGVVRYGTLYQNKR